MLSEPPRRTHRIVPSRTWNRIDRSFTTAPPSTRISVAGVAPDAATSRFIAVGSAALSLTGDAVKRHTGDVRDRTAHAVHRNGVGIDVLEALAARIKGLGWHAQIWIHAPDLVELAPRLKRLGLPLVIEHMGRMAGTRGTVDAGFQTLGRLFADGTAWTKISYPSAFKDSGNLWLRR